MKVDANPPRRTTLRGVLLDVDGTLVDSNDAHAHAWVAALAEAGHAVAFERVRALIGKGGDKLLPEVSGIAKESAQGEAIGARRGAIFKERYLGQLRAFPQTRALIERMRAAGLRVAVASSAQEDELAALLAVAGVRDLIESATSSSDAKQSKPDPDIIQAALARLGLPPAATIMLGDTPYDIEAAARAGVPTIALRCGGWANADLAGAHAIYQDPADLLAHFADSPLV